jgi:predicted metal-dependent enzyme (double-stranded beta helix superfamily)
VSAALALPDRISSTPAGVAEVARALADRRQVWDALIRYEPDRRHYARVAGSREWEAWLLTWLPGQRTGLHDHGGSVGAFAVVDGAVHEITPAPTGAAAHRLHRRPLAAGDIRGFGADHVHEVVNAGDNPAVSLHVYAPRLTVMHRYHLDGAGRLRKVEAQRAGRDW